MRDEILGHERRIARDVALSIGELRLILGEHRLRLLDLRLGGTAIEPEHHLAGFDVLSVMDEDAVDVAVDARLDGDVGDGLNRADSLDSDRHRLARGGGDHDGNGRRLVRGAVAVCERAGASTA